MKMMYETVSIVLALRRSDRQGRFPLHTKLLALTPEMEVKVLDPLLGDNKEGDMFELTVS